jgi:site-specific DNA-methyltransferase (adenine-specific)
MFKINYNPDILSCLANLSTDEVFTPPSVVNEILDQFPKDIWSDKNITFLDPVTKSGVFLREIAKRLIVGLKDEFPNQQDLLDHIFENQLFGIALTELTSLLSRRTVYCSKTANGQHSICETFRTDEGNIKYIKTVHKWQTNGRCQLCGASREEYDRSEELESHAYHFIHSEDLMELFNMKFDVIIGNPPYHLSDSGNNVGSSPIYQLFVEQAKKLNPRYMSMIIPSRWFAGGKGLDTFRGNMLTDKRLSHLVDYPITSEVFPGLKVIGGVCYFLWESNHSGPCNVITRMKGESNELVRRLDQFDIFVRFNKAVPILEKVLAKDYSPMSKNVSTQKPFGLRTFARPTGKGRVTLYANNSVGLVEETSITKKKGQINKWKVFLSMGYGEGGETRPYPRMILGKPIIAAPPSACTETYIIVGSFETEAEAKYLDAFLRTKFVRFLVGLRKNTQHITRDRFKFVPNLPMNKFWSDELLYDHFGLSKMDAEFIDTLVRPMASEYE